MGKILNAKKKKQNFDKEMQDFLHRRREISSENTNKGSNNVDMETSEECVADSNEAESLKPLPNILSMIASTMGGGASNGSETVSLRDDELRSLPLPDLVAD